MSKLKTIILVLLLSVLMLYGQDNSFDRKWFTFNTGLCGAENWDPALHYILAFNFSSKHNNIKLKYTYNIASGLFSESLKRIYDLGLLYGFKPDFEYGSVILSGGVSVVGGYYHTSEFDVEVVDYVYEKHSILSVGFPYELEFNWNIFRKFGIGLSFFGDLNFDRSFYGAGVNVNIGTLR